MMATTHALVGAAIGLALTALAPEQAPLVVATGLVGGFFPDFDLYVGHRRTLHFPVYYSAWAGVLAGVALVLPTALTVALAAFALAAAAHSVMDIFGSGLELRPWRGESDRAVYNHALGRWHAPRRLVRYDGAPEDFLLGLGVALPVLANVDGSLWNVVFLAVLVSAGYAVVRKRLPNLTEQLLSYTPPVVVTYLPERFVEG